MSRNGSGTFAVINTFSAGASITASGHNTNWTDAALEITNSLAVDGQSTMTGQIKAANGSVGAPSWTFGTDLDSGWYRIGANNIGAAVNGAKVLDVATTGLSVTGTFTLSGASILAAQSQSYDGTVALPAYSFTNDLDCGWYRIGANNIGAAVNGAKVLDVSTTGLNVIGTVSQNGTALSPFAQGVGMVNGTIVESHTGNAVTFSILTLAAATPSATDPVTFGFRNSAVNNGNYTAIQVTAGLTLTISSGSTMGFASGVAGKLWIVAFNDAGTVRLGVINCLSGTNIYPLGQVPIASSTAEGGAGAADSAQTFYANATITSKPYCLIGYASYETGVGPPGAWSGSPTRIQLTGYGVKLPGDVIQTLISYTSGASTGATAVPLDNTIPQNTEGDQFMSQAIVPSSASNILEITSQSYTANTNGGTHVNALFQDSSANALAVGGTTPGANAIGNISLLWRMLAATTSSTTFKSRLGSATGTTTFNGASGAGLYNSTLASYIKVSEIVA